MDVLVATKRNKVFMFFSVDRTLINTHVLTPCWNAGMILSGKAPVQIFPLITELSITIESLKQLNDYKFCEKFTATCFSLD